MFFSFEIANLLKLGPEFIVNMNMAWTKQKDDLFLLIKSSLQQHSSF